MTDELKITAWPSTPRERRWHRFLEAARKKWGYEQVSAAEIYAAFDRRVRADLEAFQIVAPGRYRQPIDGADIIRVLRLSPRKGAFYIVQFGLMFPFIPMETGGTLRRANMSAQITPMLWDEGAEIDDRKVGLSEAIGTALDPLTDTDLIGGVHSLNGLGFVEYTLDHHWRRMLPAIKAWFEINSSLEAILETARDQSNDKTNYGTHYPSPKLIVAFVLARMGRLSEAEEALEAWAPRGLHKAPLSKWQDHLRRASSAT